MTPVLRILFVGTVDFSYHCLSKLLDQGGEVVGVITMSPEGSHYNSDFADLGPLAEAHGVPVFRINKTNDPRTISLATELKPDVIFVLGWSQLLPKEFLSISRLGVVGSHPSLLPRNRGRHPLIWALVEGLRESGLTFFFLDEGVDSGDILWQRSFEIAIEDNATTLYDKIKVLASHGIEEFLPKLANGTFDRIHQDHSKATYWRKRGKEDGEIDWSRSAMDCYNLIRALTHPYAGAQTICGYREIKVWKTWPPVESHSSATSLSTDKTGTVVGIEGSRVLVKCGDGLLHISDIEGDSEVELRVGIVLGRNEGRK